MIQGFTSVMAGDQVSASDLNRVFQELERQSGITATPPLEVLPQSTGFHLRIDVDQLDATGDKRFFLAKILSGSNPYAWQEMTYATGGTFATLSGGRSGTASVNPAYEINSITIVKTNSFVWMTKGFNNTGSVGQEYIFAASVGSLTGFTGSQLVVVDPTTCATKTETFSSGLCTGIS